MEKGRGQRGKGGRREEGVRKNEGGESEMRRGREEELRIERE